MGRACAWVTPQVRRQYAVANAASRTPLRVLRTIAPNGGGCAKASETRLRKGYIRLRRRKKDDVKMEPKQLNKGGEYDYDYLNDILFFKVKDREYSRSIELDEIIVDVDEENFIVGIQMFNASELFNLPKYTLKNVRKWEFQASVDSNRLEVKLAFQTMMRNKIIEPRPMIIEQLKQPLPNSKVVSVMS
ncbi:MAG: DUF2283 domain-containing protein [Candidatus Micrarchaeota archaeon]